MWTEIPRKILSLVLCYWMLPNDSKKKVERKLKEIIKIPFSKWKNKNFMLIYILSLILLRCYVFSSSFPFASCVYEYYSLWLMCLLPLPLFLYSNTGFLCLVIYRRDTHVVELQIGNLTSRLEDACAPDQYDVSRTPFTTLLGRMRIHFSHSENQTQKKEWIVTPPQRGMEAMSEKKYLRRVCGRWRKTFE